MSKAEQKEALQTRIVAIAMGLVVVAMLIGGFLYYMRGSHIQIQGQIQKVRLQSMEDKSTLVVIDFRFVNPADYPFWVRKVDVFLEPAKGDEMEGLVSSETDLKPIFQYYTMLGPKYNDTFKIREKVAPKASLDRMVAARFELPQADVEARKGLRIRVEEVDGAVSEITEDRK